jgi:hypothetical protein
MFKKSISFLLASLVFGLTTPAQQATTPSATQDQSAIAIALKSRTTLTGAVQISDVTLTGSVMRTAGSDVGTGTFTLRAVGGSASRMDLSLSDGISTEIRTLSTGVPQGEWLAPGGVYTAMPLHNCLTDAAWFFPAFTVLSKTSDVSLTVVYVGQETRNDISVQHLHFAFSGAVQPNNSPALDDPLATLSSSELYIDSTTFLPVALDFNTHPDNDARANIPVEIVYSNYQTTNGILMPFRIQKFLNGSLFIDFTVQSVALNTGLTSSTFNAN